MRRYILTITCPDRVGIVAAVTGLIAARDGSVLQAAQHGDLDSGRFFLRIEIVADSLPDGFGPMELAEAFEPVAAEFDMRWHLSDTDVPKRVVLFTSKEDHCLADLLYRWRAGELECEVPCVISNHEDLRSLVEWHGIPFRWVPVGTEPAAKALAQSHPAVAARVFRALCMRTLKAAKSKYYDAALAHLKEARKCYLAAGLEQKWEGLSLEIRRDHFRKSSFMPGFNAVISGESAPRDASFLDRARRRWAAKTTV